MTTSQTASSPATARTVLPHVLVFSATDPSTGAGMQADLLTLVSLGCHPLCVVTAVTVQDSTGVESLHPVEPDVLERQARLILEDSPVHAIKIGLLGSVENLVRVAEIISDYPNIPVVLDPVLASGRGDDLSTEDLIGAMRDLLLPQVTVITPNTLEARRVAFADVAGGMVIADDDDEQDDVPHHPGIDVNLSDYLKRASNPANDADEDDDTPEPELADCATELLSMGVQYVLITGTHDTSTAQVVNTLYDENGYLRSDSWPRLPGSYHGSGCTLASAVAAGLAAGMPIQEAVREAQEYTWQTLAHALRPGMGQFIPDRLFWARPDYVAANTEATTTPDTDSTGTETPPTNNA